MVQRICNLVVKVLLLTCAVFLLTCPQGHKSIGNAVSRLVSHPQIKVESRNSQLSTARTNSSDRCRKYSSEIVLPTANLDRRQILKRLESR